MGQRHFMGFVLGVFSFSCMLLFPAQAERVPMPPGVYLGGHGQAAIVLDNRSSTPAGPRLGLEPSRIVAACADGRDGLYFVAAPEPLRLYHWSLGDAGATLEAVRDALSTDVMAMMGRFRDAQGPEALPAASYLFKDGLLYEADGMRPLPTPPFEAIDQWIPLPGGMLAVVSFSQGISVVNTGLSPGPRLAVDPDYGYSEAMLRGFAMANPHIRLEHVACRDRRDCTDGGFLPLHAYPREAPGQADVFFVPIEEAQAAARRNLLLDLSASAELSSRWRSYAPAIREAIQNQSRLIAMPGLVEPWLWATYEECIDNLGQEAIPKTLDDLMALIDGKNGVYLDSGAYSPDQVLGLWMVRQYMVQYAREDQPLNFDTPVFRKLLEGLKAYWEGADRVNAKGGRVFHIDHLRAHDLYDGSVPFLPPAFARKEETKTYAEMYAWCADAQTPYPREALCFIEFAMQYLDPVYACYLSPGEYTPIPSPVTTAKRALWETEYRQALASGHGSAKAVRRSLAENLRALGDDWPLLHRPVFEFYRQEAFPRLRFLLGGLYRDMGESGSPADPLDAVYALEYGASSIDSAMETLNRQAGQEYALWH